MCFFVVFSARSLGGLVLVSLFPFIVTDQCTFSGMGFGKTVREKFI